MSASLRQLGVVSRQYETKADEYITALNDAAQAKADLTKAKAQFKLSYKMRAENPEKVSDVELEMRAHANDEIAALYEDLLLKEATEKGLESKLRQLKTQNDNGRTAVVGEREVDKIHANGWSGAA